MDFKEIKEIIEADGGKFIIVENGKPVMVITSYQDFKNKLTPHHFKKTKIPHATLSKSGGGLPEELASDELKIEDLPF